MDLTCSSEMAIARSIAWQMKESEIKNRNTLNEFIASESFIIFFAFIDDSKSGDTFALHKHTDQIHLISYTKLWTTEEIGSVLLRCRRETTFQFSKLQKKQN